MLILEGGSHMGGSNMATQLQGAWQYDMWFCFRDNLTTVTPEKYIRVGFKVLE